MLRHELRNPLAPIRNITEVLRRTAGGDPNYGSLCTMLERQVHQLTRLLDDLLDVGRITQGKIKFQRELVVFQSVVQRAVEASRPLIDARGQRLTLNMPKAPLPVTGDLARLVQMLTNLLNNAAKYTPDGGRISLRAHRRNDALEIRVEDSGAGIAPDMLPRIFDLFVQGDSAMSQSGDGLGIGLTLVRSIVQHRGGRVEASSAGRGHGSERTIRLPMAKGALLEDSVRRSARSEPMRSVSRPPI